MVTASFRKWRREIKMDRGGNTSGKRAEEQMSGFQSAFTAMAGDPPQLSCWDKDTCQVQNNKTPKSITRMLPLMRRLTNSWWANPLKEAEWGSLLQFITTQNTDDLKPLWIVISESFSFISPVVMHVIVKRTALVQFKPIVLHNLYNNVHP